MQTGCQSLSSEAFQDLLVSIERSDPWQGCVQFGDLLCPPTGAFHNVRRCQIHHAGIEGVAGYQVSHLVSM